MKKNPLAIAAPLPGVVAEIRTPVEGKTSSIVIKVKSWAFLAHSGQIQLTADIVGADFDEGIDGRVARQKASIERLLAHVMQHCPEFLSGQMCEYNGGE